VVFGRFSICYSLGIELVFLSCLLVPAYVVIADPSVEPNPLFMDDSEMMEVAVQVARPSSMMENAFTNSRLWFSSVLSDNKQHFSSFIQVR
jgi:hypothetical protein